MANRVNQSVLLPELSFVLYLTILCSVLLEIGIAAVEKVSTIERVSGPVEQFLKQEEDCDEV